MTHLKLKLLLIPSLFFLTLSLFSFSYASSNQLKNKAPFFAESDSSLPRNIIIFSFKSATEKVSPEKQGVFPLLEYMIDEGPQTQSIKEYKKNLFLNGIQIHSGAEYGIFKIYIQAPPQYTEEGLTLLKNTLVHLRTTEADFERLKARVSSDINTSFEQMRSVILYFGVKDLFNYAPEVMNGSTSPTSFEKINLVDLKTELPKILDFKNLFVSFVGPTNPDLIKKQIESVFKDSLKSTYSPPKRKKLNPITIENKKYTVIHKEDATDNQIFILFPQSILYGSPQWYQASLLQQLLGGGLGSALNKTLRVERGLTYGVSSRMSGLNFPYWYINTFGGLKQTLPLLKGIDEVLTKFLTTPSEQELFDASIEISLNAFQSGRELALDRIGSQAAHYAHHLDYRVIQEFPKKLKALKKVDVENFKKHLQAKNAAFYLMGNKDFLKKNLMELGVKESDIRVVNKAEIR